MVELPNAGCDSANRRCSMRTLLRSHLSRSLGYPQVGAGLGMLAMAAHGLFDFNFHIPANALYFSFLAGVFFFTPPEDRA